MKLNEAIKGMLGTKTQSQLAEAINYKTGALSTLLKRNNMQVKTLITMAEAMDYELVLRPKSGTNKAERTYVINDAEKSVEESKE